MWRKWLAWMWADVAGLGQITPWNQVISDYHAARTERLLLGACRPARVELSAAQRARRRQA